MKLVKTRSRPLKAWEKEVIQAIHHWNINMTEHDKDLARKAWKAPTTSKRLLDPINCIFTQCMAQLKSQ